MKAEDELENIIREKEFAALTEEERALVLRTVGSEEAYDTLRKIELAVSSDNYRSTLEPRPQILHALQHRMKKQCAPIGWENIFLMKIPAYAAIVGVLVISALIFVLRPTEMVNPSEIVEAVSPEKPNAPVQRVDTVFITRIDTVVRQRIVYRQVNLASQSVKLDLVQAKQVSGSGVNMKEKEELNKLLVSGSD